MDNKKDQPNSFPTKTKSEFFEILDEVEKYDQEITAMNELFGEAMLSLSSLYFVNPYSSIKSHGYKPTPALLKYNQHQQQLKFCYSTFCLDPSTQEEQDYEEERQIQSQTQKLMKRNDLRNQEKIMGRFGTTSNERETLLASQKFRKTLDQIMKIAEMKKEMEKKFKNFSIQNKGE